MSQQSFHRSLFLVLVCLLVALRSGGTSLTSQEERVVGRWESVARSQGGIGTTLELRSDGKVSLTPGAMVDYTYRLSGSRLVLSFTDPDTGNVSEKTVDFSLSGDSMVQTDPESGQETRFVRSAPAYSESAPIVGTWSFKHDTGVTAFQVFTADGKIHLRVPFRTDVGEYQVSREILTIVMKGRDPMRYVIDGETLALPEARGAGVQYRRVPW